VLAHADLSPVPFSPCPLHCAAHQQLHASVFGAPGPAALCATAWGERRPCDSARGFAHAAQGRTPKPGSALARRRQEVLLLVLLLLLQSAPAPRSVHSQGPTAPQLRAHGMRRLSYHNALGLHADQSKLPRLRAPSKACSLKR
jgi:hypothetical protein